MTWFNQFYVHAGRTEFRRVFKREFYAYAYNHAASTKLFKDFSRMYDMGGEL